MNEEEKVLCQQCSKELDNRFELERQLCHLCSIDDDYGDLER